MTLSKMTRHRWSGIWSAIKRLHYDVDGITLSFFLFDSELGRIVLVKVGLFKKFCSLFGQIPLVLLFVC